MSEPNPKESAVGSVYGSMGVDAHKGNVERAFKGKISNEYPYAFVNITRDKKAPEYVKTLKVDGDGSRPTQHCLEYLETGDTSVFGNSFDDVFQMPVGDGAAAGFVDEIAFQDVLDLNKLTIPNLKDAILDAVSQRAGEVVNLHRRYGFDVEFFGGETADLPSQTPSYICNGFMWARTHVSKVIKGMTLPGDHIWGFASYGQALWENQYNPGLMCNGITLGCAVIMWEGYNQKYPFLRHENQKFRGRFKVDDRPDGLEGLTASQALRSPTRHFSIVMKLLIEELKKQEALHLLHGLTMNTGGGATKVRRLGKHIRYVKKMPEPPPIFQLIRQEGNVPKREMYEDFNNGVGVDVIGSSEGGTLEAAIRKVSFVTDVPHFYLGSCEMSNREDNEVVVYTPLQKDPFIYPEK